MKFETLNLYVEDMSKTIQFYSLLGFTFKSGDEDKSYVKLALENINISFYSMEEVHNFFKSPPLQLNEGNQYNMSFRVKNPEIVDEIHEKMKRNGIEPFKGPLDADWEQRVLFYKDPDNNLIEICAHLP